MKTQEYDKQSEQIIDMLTPKMEVKPSADLRGRILRTAKQQAEQHAEQPRRRTPLYWLGTIASVAAVIAIAITLTLNTPAYAARRYFSEALTVAEDIKTMVMQLSVRTEKDEPIDYIHPSHDFIPATIKVIYDEPMLWSIEKKDGRTVLFNGGNQLYEWLNGGDNGIGWVKYYDGYPNGDLAVFLDPRLLLEAELRTAERNRGTKYATYDNGETVVVSVTTIAQGDFSESEYMLNTSILEANTIREYTFAKATSELLKLRIDFVIDSQPVTVIESEVIRYNEPMSADDLYDEALFESVAFQTADIEGAESSPLACHSADEAAKIILDAMSDWNTEILSTAMCYYRDFMPTLEAKYKGMKVKSVKKAVKSGLYPGRFVECQVILANGEKERLVLALRNDNSSHIWLLDGGL
ncbi:MAG: hypothetical protein E7131_03425 [Rikenellaceae bacterium]|nr:hypothetical protein [Rikenellaceae bacterium]